MLTHIEEVCSTSSMFYYLHKSTTMNRIISVFIFLLLLSSSGLKAQYCSSTAQYSDWEYISNVKFGSIDNTTQSGLYQNFATSLSSQLYIGESYPLVIKTENYSSTDRMEIYIDWNDDKAFSISEKMNISFTGVSSKQGTCNATIIPVQEAEGKTIRMRIVLYDSGSAYSGYSNGCGTFEYGEVEDYSFQVLTISTPPNVDFFANETSIFTEGVVRFADKSNLLPTQWEWTINPATIQFTEGTSATSQNPVVKFLEAGNYSITLKATNSVGSNTLTKTNYIVVKNYSAPKNLSATTEGSHVNLQWQMPNIPAWNSYVADINTCTNLILTLTDIATLYNDADFNFSFPVTISKLGTMFYYSNSLPWSNDQFKFKIVKQSNNQVVFESPVLKALHFIDFVYELPEPITLNEPFMVVVSSSSTDGTPTGMAMEVDASDCHTLVWNTETNAWESFVVGNIGYEMYTKVYIGHDAKSSKTIERGNNTYSRYTGKLNLLHKLKNSVLFSDAKGASTLAGYILYRNNQYVDSIKQSTTTTYTDNGLADGDYAYNLKAYYTPNGLSVSSNTVNVTVDNSNPELQVIYDGKEVIQNSLLNFPSNVDVNSTRTISFTIHNEGRGVLNLGEVTLDNSMFTVTQQPQLTLNGDATTTLSIQFNPTVEGPQTCKVTFTNNDSNENPFSFNLKAIGGQDRWTWMLYMLEDATGLDGDKDINEWEVAGSVPGEVNYLVLWDANNDSRDGIWYIKKDANGYNRTLVSEKVSSFLGIDPDMSSKETLKQFIMWVKDNYPAQHYGLTVWDHGDGIFKKSNSTDNKAIDKGFVGTMKLWEMSSSVEQFVQAVGKKIDIVGFDVCLLGQIETAYQFKDLAKYILASEKTEPGDGWDYYNGFTPLSGNSALSSDSIAKRICKTYTDAYAPGGWSYQASSTQAVVSIDSLNTILMPKLNVFADSLIKYVADYKSQFKAAKNSSYAAPGQTQPLDNPDHRDLGHFAKLLIANNELPQGLKQAAQNMLDAYQNTVIYHTYTGGENANATGMKIWMPEEIMDEGTATNYYTKPTTFLKFGETRWVNYLKAFQTPPASTAPKAVFNMSSNELAVNTKLFFTDVSLQSPNQWEWTITPSVGVSYVSGTSNSSANPVVEFSTPGYYSVKLKVQNSFGADDTLRAYAVKVVNPNADAPGLLKAQLSGSNVNLDWASDVMFTDDNFDSYAPFSLNFGSWKQVDVDKSVTYGINGYIFPNSSYTGSFIVFDGSKTTPAIEGWSTPSGTQAIACFDASTPPNNDWLISAKVSVKDGDVLSFYGCSITDTYGLERIKVGISTTGRNPEDFTFISTSPYVEVPKTWTKFEYNLSAYVGQEIYFCVQVVSNDAWCLFLDDFHVGASTTKKAATIPINFSVKEVKSVTAKYQSSISNTKSLTLTGYKIFRNDTEISTPAISASSYTDINPGNGKHVYYMLNVYTDGTNTILSSPSNMVSVNINPTSITDNKRVEPLKLYPNPAKEQVTVFIPEQCNGNLTVVNLMGQNVLSMPISNENQIIVPLGSLTKGIYIVYIQGNTGSYTSKLVIE